MKSLYAESDVKCEGILELGRVVPLYQDFSTYHLVNFAQY